jgi:hypothetical protein
MNNYLLENLFHLLLLTYIDLDNNIYYLNKELKSASIESSFSLEFHPKYIQTIGVFHEKVGIGYFENG